VCAGANGDRNSVRALLEEGGAVCVGGDFTRVGTESRPYGALVTVTGPRLFLGQRLLRADDRSLTLTIPPLVDAGPVPRPARGREPRAATMFVLLVAGAGAAAQLRRLARRRGAG